MTTMMMAPLEVNLSVVTPVPRKSIFLVSFLFIALPCNGEVPYQLHILDNVSFELPVRLLSKRADNAAAS